MHFKKVIFVGKCLSRLFYYFAPQIINGTGHIQHLFNKGMQFIMLPSFKAQSMKDSSLGGSLVYNIFIMDGLKIA